MTTALPTENGLEIITRALRRHGYLVLLLSLLGVAAGFAFIHFIPPRFQAEALVRIDPIRLPVLADIDSSSRPIDNTEILSEIQILKSPAIALRVARPPESHLEVSDILKGLEIYNPVRSRILQIRFSHRDPEVAAHIANTIALEYIAYDLEEKRKQGEQVSRFITQRLQELREDVRQAEENIARYKTQQVNQSGLNQDLLNQQIAQLNLKILDATTKINEIESKLKEHDQGFETIQPGPVLSQLKMKEIDLRRKISELSNRYGPKHPRMIEAQAEAMEIEDALAQAFEDAREHLQTEKRVALENLAALRQELSRLQSIESVKRIEDIELKELEQQADIATTLLKMFLENAEKLKQQQSLQQSNATLIARATPPQSPTFPNPVLILLITTGGGFLTGIFLILFMASVGQSQPQDDLIQNMTGKPVLGYLSKIPSKKMKALGDWMVHHSSSVNAQEIKNIVMNLNAISKGFQKHKIFGLSPVAVHSRQTAVIGLWVAQLASKSGLKTLFMDCHPKGGNIPSLLPDLRGIQLSDLLGPDQDASSRIPIARDESTGLHVIFCGSKPPEILNPQTHHRLKLLLGAFGEKYDLVILNLPPVLESAETKILSSFVHGLVLIKKVEEDLNTLDKAMRTLDSDKVFGTVLTDLKKSPFSDK